MKRARQPAELSVAQRPSAAHRTGTFLLLTAVLTLVMVYARVAADADRPELLDSLRAIAESRAMYSLSAVARLVSGLTLFAGAWFLWRTSFVQGRLGKPAASALLAISGAFTADSGLCALILASIAPDAAALGSADSFTEGVAYLRWLTGKLGFAAAGVALAVIAMDRWNSDGAFKTYALATAVLGVSMQFIWVDSATAMHRIVGVLFFCWLVVSGIMLLRGRLRQTPDDTVGSR